MACACTARARLAACFGSAGVAVVGASVADKAGLAATGRGGPAAEEIAAIGVRSKPGAVVSSRPLTGTAAASVDGAPFPVSTADCDELAVACAGAASSGSRSAMGFGASVAGTLASAVEEVGTIGVAFAGDEVVGFGSGPADRDCEAAGGMAAASVGVAASAAAMGVSVELAVAGSEPAGSGSGLVAGIGGSVDAKSFSAAEETEAIGVRSGPAAASRSRSLSGECDRGASAALRVR